MKKREADHMSPDFSMNLGLQNVQIAEELCDDQGGAKT